MKHFSVLIVAICLFMACGVVCAKEQLTPSKAIKHSIESVKQTFDQLDEGDVEDIEQTQLEDDGRIDANTLDENGNLLVRVYQERNRFGLEKTDGTRITGPIYKKLVRLGDKSWIVQKRTKFGVIDYYGDYVILPKYRNVQRIANKYVKLGNDNDYGLYDEYGFTIIQPEYSSIDLLDNKVFLTKKNFRYGVMDLDGNTILQNDFDDIYMSSPTTMMVQYRGDWCKVEIDADKEISFPGVAQLTEDKDLTVTDVVVNTGVGAGYSVVTLTNYLSRMIAAISPAYEATIDELMYSQGADTISILMKLSWIPKFPIVYVKQYYRQLRNPNAGLFSTTRNNLKNKMK